MIGLIIIQQIVNIAIVIVVFIIYHLIDKTIMAFRAIKKRHN